MIVGFTWALLLGGSYYDLRYRALPNIFFAVGGGLSVVLAFIMQPVSVLSLAGGIGLGAAVLGLSFLTRGGIGLGDGLFVGLLGINLGFSYSFSVFVIALLLSALVAMGLLLVKRKDRKYALPFIPFLAAAYGIVCFLSNI